MNEEKVLEEYFAICRRIYEQMVRDGTWPWQDDSPNEDNLIELDVNSNDS